MSRRIVMHSFQEFCRNNKTSLCGAASALLVLAFNLIEAFGNVFYTNWFRNNIHLFTPILPGFLVVTGILRKESVVISVISFIIISLHYSVIYVLYLIGFGAAGALKWL